jgi:hypothetical protein
MTLSNNVLTVATTAAHKFSPYAQVYIQYFSSNTPLFEGFYVIASTPSATTFTINVPFDSRVPGTATSDTSAATVVSFNCNHLQWSPVTNAWIYYVYGRSGGSYNLIGVTRPQEPFWDDYGSPLEDGLIAESYIPTTAPVSASNQYLLAKVIAGGGTTKLTVTPSASHSVSRKTARMGSDGGILAAFTAANSIAGGNVGAKLYIPTGAFYLAGHFIVPTSYVGYRIQENGSLVLADTFDANGQTLSWYGDAAHTASQFQWESTASVGGNSGGNPMIYGLGSYSHIEHMTFSDYGGNQGVIFVQDLINLSMDYVTMSEANYPMAQMFMERGDFGFKFHKMAFMGSQYPNNAESSIGYTFLPGVVFKARVDGTSTAVGDFNFDSSWFVGRSGVEVSGAPGRPGDSCPGGVAAGTLSASNTQNMDIPLFILSSYPCVNPVVASGIGWNVLDTQPADFPTSLISSFAESSAQAGIFYTGSSVVQGGRNIYTGIPMAGGYTVPGANHENNNYGAAYGIFANHPTYGAYIGGYFQMSENMDMPAGHGITLSTARVGAPTVTNLGAGLVQPGAHYYQVAIVGADGADGIAGPPTWITIPAGSPAEVQISWTDVPGATGYRVWRDSQMTAYCGSFSPVLSNSCIDNVGFTNGALPTVSATGLPSLYPGKITTQKLVFASTTAGNYGIGTFSGHFTANRTITIPDATFTMAQVIAQGTSTLGTSAIADMTCASVVTTPADGVTTADVISYSFNAAPSGTYTTGLFLQSYVTPGNVNFLVCNPTATSLTPPAATLNWRVTR